MGGHSCVSPGIYTGDADADRDGAEDVQAERICLPQYERSSSEEQANVHDESTQLHGGGNQESLPSEEVTIGLQSGSHIYPFTALNVGVSVYTINHKMISCITFAVTLYIEKIPRHKTSGTTAIHMWLLHNNNKNIL